MPLAQATGGQCAVGGELVHQAGQHAGELAGQLGRLHAQFAGHVRHRILAQHARQLLGADGRIGTMADPGVHHVAQPGLLKLVDQALQPAVFPIIAQQAGCGLHQLRLVAQRAQQAL